MSDAPMPDAITEEHDDDRLTMEKLVAEYACDSEEEFLHLVGRRSPVWYPQTPWWIFRGHANSNWKLIPSALREGEVLFYESGYKKIGPLPTRREQVQAEHHGMQQFISFCDAQGLPIPDDSYATRAAWDEHIGKALHDAMTGKGPWPPPALFSAMGLAQHYGIGTRLLDWTRDPIFAAYFAAYKASLWALEECDRPERATHLEVIGLRLAFALDTLKPMETDELPRIRLVTAPAALIPNLRAQRGLFTVVLDPLGDPAAPPRIETLERVVLERLIAGYADDPNDGFPLIQHPWFVRIRLPIERAPFLLAHVGQEWASALTAFPGHDGVVKGIKEKAMWRFR